MFFATILPKQTLRARGPKGYVQGPSRHFDYALWANVRMYVHVTTKRKSLLYTVARRGVARIFSEVRTILQITLHPPPRPFPAPKNFSWFKIRLVVSLTVFFLYTKFTLATYEILCRVFGSIYWCTSVIYHIACVEEGLYTGYYHAIRFHTFLDSLLYFLILGSFRRF